MTREELFKKELAKAVKGVRDRETHGEYPKLMMTGKQMEKRTGTINCGVYWRSQPDHEGKTKAIAEKTLADREVSATLAYFGAKPRIEWSEQNNAWQVRFWF